MKMRIKSATIEMASTPMVVPHSAPRVQTWSTASEASRFGGLGAGGLSALDDFRVSV